MKTELVQSCGHCWVFIICWHIECTTFTASSFMIWNSSSGISSPPLALFVVMLPKTHLTSHSRMSGSRWVITLIIPLDYIKSWRWKWFTLCLKIPKYNNIFLSFFKIFAFRVKFLLFLHGGNFILIPPHQELSAKWRGYHWTLDIDFEYFLSHQIADEGIIILLLFMDIKFTQAHWY